MAKIPLARQALVAIVTLLLLGLLAFLFVRTAGHDFRSEASSLGLLRELKDLDMRWDADAGRLVDDLAGSESTTGRGERAARVAEQLVRPPVPEALALHATALQQGVAAKQRAWIAIAEAHARSRASLAAAENALAAVDAAALAARARVQRPTDLPLLVERIRGSLRLPALAHNADAAAALEAPLATLQPAALALDTSLAEPAARAQQAVAAFLRVRRAEGEAFRSFTFLTVGSRMDLAAREVAEGFTRAIESRAPWRVYLMAYAAALLIGVVFLALRVSQQQAALRIANADLEQRVEARTRELSQALVQLKESEAQLVQTEKMSSLGRMVAGVAHEINTPLAYVKNSLANARDRVPELEAALGQAEELLALLQSEEPDGERLQATFDSLNQVIGRIREGHVFEDLRAFTKDGLHGIEEISELVRNLRNFSRLDRSKVASFDVNEGIRAALLIAKPQLTRMDVELKLGTVPSITCSPSQVNQVLLNVVTNAAQAMDKPRGRLVISTRAHGDGVLIEIGDDGHGIPPEVLPKIFDPFFTTKEVGKGTGLGLSIAYKIVKEHGGRIEARSQPGKGTVFAISLPIHPPATLATEVAEARA